MKVIKPDKGSIFAFLVFLVPFLLMVNHFNNQEEQLKKEAKLIEEKEKIVYLDLAKEINDAKSSICIKKPDSRECNELYKINTYQDKYFEYHFGEPDDY